MSHRYIKFTALATDDSGNESTVYLNAAVLPFGLTDCEEEGTLLSFNDQAVFVSATIDEVMEAYNIQLTLGAQHLN